MYFPLSVHLINLGRCDVWCETRACYWDTGWAVLSEAHLCVNVLHAHRCFSQFLKQTCLLCQICFFPRFSAIKLRLWRRVRAAVWLLPNETCVPSRLSDWQLAVLFTENNYTNISVCLTHMHMHTHTPNLLRLHPNSPTRTLGTKTSFEPWLWQYTVAVWQCSMIENTGRGGQK